LANSYVLVLNKSIAGNIFTKREQLNWLLYNT